VIIPVFGRAAASVIIAFSDAGKPVRGGNPAHVM